MEVTAPVPEFLWGLNEIVHMKQCCPIENVSHMWKVKFSGSQIKSSEKKHGKINLLIYFLSPIVSQVLSFQHVISTKIISKIFSFFLFFKISLHTRSLIPSLQNWACILHLQVYLSSTLNFHQNYSNSVSFSEVYSWKSRFIYSSYVTQIWKISSN